MYTHMSTRIHSYTHTHIHASARVHTLHLYTITCTHFYKLTLTPIYVHTCTTHIQLHIHMPTLLHSCTHTCTYTHVHTHTRGSRIKAGDTPRPKCPLDGPCTQTSKSGGDGENIQEGPPGGGAADSESHLPPFANHTPALNTFFFFNHLSGERVAWDLWGQLRQFCKMTL